ncbi:MAG: hypothetical protein N3C57_06385 [Aquificaceae bacterium]|nr:hypothetical protein [Aquificaceae bacterium]
MVINGVYVTVGRLCPSLPYAAIWEDGVRAFESRLRGYGIFHSISSNGVISGADSFAGIVWNRAQNPSPTAIVRTGTYSRYDSVISEDGISIAFYDDRYGNTTVWRDNKRATVSGFYPTAVINRGNVTIVYGKSGGKASRFSVDFSGSPPVVSSIEDLNNVYSNIIPSGVKLLSTKDISTDGRFLLLLCKVNDKETPCVIDHQLVQSSILGSMSVETPRSTQDGTAGTVSAGGGCSMVEGSGVVSAFMWLVIPILVLLRRRGYTLR